MASQEQEHSEALSEIIRQYQELGRLLPQHQAAVDAAATGIPGFAKGLSVADKAAGSMAGAFTSAAGAMYQGQKGLKAFDGAIDKTADALMILTGALALIGGPITLLAAGLTAAVAAGAKYVKAANEQSDKLFEAYRGMAQAGAAAQDGLQGLYNDVKRLGGGIQDLDDFVSMVSGSAQDLASFRGTVFDGRKDFARMVHAMKPFRLGMEQAGITQKAQNEGTLAFIRLQSRVGLTQNKVTDDLSEGARKYIIEQDRLAKLTGLNAKQQEDLRAAARQRETFAATLLELRNRGDERSAKAAKNLESTFVVLSQHSKDMGEGFLDETLRTEAAQKLYRLTQGESLRVQQELKEGLITDVQALDRLAKATDNFINSQGVSMGKLGNVANFAGDLAGAISFAAKGMRGFEKSVAKANQTQEEQALFGGTALDDEVNSQAKLRLTQVDAMQNMQDFVRRGVTPATSATAFFGRVVEKVTKLFKGSDSLAKEYDAERLVQQREEQVSKAYEELIDARAANEIVEESNNEKDKETARINLETAKSKFATAKIERDAANAALLAINTPPAASARRPTGRTQGQSTPGAKLSPAETQAILEGGSERDIASFGGREALARIAGSTKSSAPAAAKASKPTSALPSSSTYPSSGPTSGAQPAAGPAAGADGRTASITLSGGGATGGASTSYGAGIPGMAPVPPEQVPTLAKIRDLIASVESKGNYNVVFGGQQYPLTSMTVSEVLQLQKQLIAEKGFSAAGKYQFVYQTLAGLIGKSGVGLNDKFDEITQDKLADYSIRQRGFDQYARNPAQEGKERFLSNLAKEWAGLPAGPNNQSYYAKDNINKSHIGWNEALARFGDGGIVRTPTYAQIGEKGPEAVIPLKNGAVPVSFNNNQIIVDSLNNIASEFKQALATLTTSMQQNQTSVLPDDALAALQTIASATKSTADIQDKLLRVAQN
jgi:hypothetical protein